MVEDQGKMKSTKDKQKADETTSIYSMFMPKSSRALYVDYPELKKYDSLKVLTKRQILFAWYYSCEASPYFKISDSLLRAKKSAEESYFVGKKLTCSRAEYNDVLNLNFPPRLAAGVKTMERFKIGPRVRAKMIYEKSFGNIEKILDIDASDEMNFVNKDGEPDQAKKKAYVDTVSSAVKIIPELIDRLEGNLGLTSKEESEEDEQGSDGVSFIDEYHEQK